jgi:hypothetical protein
MIDEWFELEPITFFDGLHCSVILYRSQWDMISGILLHFSDICLLFALMVRSLFELVLNSPHFRCYLFIFEFKQTHLNL